MWPFKKKLPQRRLEVRKAKPAGPGLWPRFRAGGGIGSSLLMAALFVVALFFDAVPLQPAPYRSGGHLDHDVYARLDFQMPADAPRPTTQTTRPAGRNIQAGSLIVKQTVAGALGDAELDLLVAEHEAYLDQQRSERPLRRWLVLLGRAGMVGAVIFLLALYVVKYQPRVVTNHWRGFAIVALIALVLGLTKAAVGPGGLNPHLSVFGVFVAAAILTIAYDQRFAFAVTGALVLLTALQLRASLGEMLVLWAAAAATVFQLRDIRTRSKLIQTGGVAAAVVFVAVWLVQFAEGTPWQVTLIDSALAATAAFAAGFITQGILPLIERIFQIATSMTLLEWCDANRSLLKRLALEAPGTYSHSLLLGTMCEAASETIGAHGLLARVGAYYHDIGKVHKPGYFVENQPGPGSKHDKLSPAMSLLLIKGHVKDGMEMAKEYNLPRVLHEFIASHHGTTLVEYFYHAATQQRKSNGQSAPDEVEFRYGGPKPRLKEAAILMLADACESSVRAMSEPTAGRIETQVHTMVTKRLTDGQLDDCEMTLKEVHAIEVSLIKSLCGMHHARVPYPSDGADEDAKEPTDYHRR